jgi:hypothetical protein
MAEPAVFSIDLHQQDKDCFCGPACAMMIIGEFSKPIEELNQRLLFQDLRTPPDDPFETSPEGLARVLNAQFPGHQYDVRMDTAENLAELLVNSFCDAAPVPAVLLINGCSHWSVVTGVKTEPEPADGVDYAVSGFYMNIPTQVPMASSDNPHPPPPHGKDDSCPKNLDEGQDFFQYDWWKTHMVLPCELRNDLSVAVCRVGQKIGTMLKAPAQAPIKRRRLLLARIARIAIAGVTRHELLAPKTEDGVLSAGRPHLVKRLHRPGEHYYLVPLFRGRTRLGMALVDPELGFGAAHLTATEPAILTAVELSARLPGPLSESLRTLFERPALRGKTRVRRHLVWRPSRHSPTPFQPFHVVCVGPRTSFVRSLDLRAFDDIEDPCSGG